MRISFVRHSALAIVLALASSACAESQTQDTSIGGRTPFPTANAPGTWQPPTAAQDVTAFVRPLVSSWRPKGATVVTMAADKLIATSLDGGSSTELVALAPGADWSFRRDGGAFVAAVQVAPYTTQLAIWEPATNDLRWLTAAESTQFSPVWSHDGWAIYFGVSNEVARLRADGTGRERILQTRSPPITNPVAESLDGTLYVRKAWEGPEVLGLVNLASGEERDFPGWHLEALRERQPGALISGGFFPSTGLAEVHEQTGNLMKLVQDSTEVAGADWDPTGTRIVAAVRARQTREPSVLVTMDERGGTRRVIDGTGGAESPVWVGEGILYLWAAIAGWDRWDDPHSASYGTGDDYELLPIVHPPFELHLVDPDTAASRVILRSDTKFIFRVVGG